MCFFSKPFEEALSGPSQKNTHLHVSANAFNDSQLSCGHDNSKALKVLEAFAFWPTSNGENKGRLSTPPEPSAFSSTMCNSLH